MKCLLFTLVDDANFQHLQEWIKKAIVIDFPIEIHVFSSCKDHYKVKRSIKVKSVFVHDSKTKENGILSAFNMAQKEQYLFLGFVDVEKALFKTSILDLMLSSATHGASVPVFYENGKLKAFKGEIIRMKMIPVETDYDITFTENDVAVPAYYYAISSKVLRECEFVLHEDDVYTELPYYFMQRNGIKFYLDPRIIF